MLIAERQSLLRDLIAQHGIVDLDTLARELSVSQSTVRRDVELLEQRGVVSRTHGGVMWNAEKGQGPGQVDASGAQASREHPHAFDQRLDLALEAKRCIARAAADLIQPNQTILLDGGTSTYYLARELKERAAGGAARGANRAVQLVTNSLPIAHLLQNDESVELVLTGGVVYPRYGIMLGPITDRFLAEVHTHTMFFSVAGINDGRLFNQNLLLVESEKRMMAQSQQIVLLADSTKFGQQALVEICPLEKVTTVISDPGLSGEWRERIVNAGVRLMIAGEF